MFPSEAASSDSDLQSVVVEEMNTIIQCGFTKPLHRVSCSDKIDLIALQSVILSSLGELSTVL